MDWTTGMVEYWNGGLESFHYLSCCSFPVVFTNYIYIPSYSHNSTYVANG